MSRSSRSSILFSSISKLLTSFVEFPTGASGLFPTLQLRRRDWRSLDRQLGAKVVEVEARLQRNRSARLSRFTSSGATAFHVAHLFFTGLLQIGFLLAEVAYWTTVSPRVVVFSST